MALLVGTHNICFCGEIKKILMYFVRKKVPYQELCSLFLKGRISFHLETNFFPFTVDPYSKGTGSVGKAKR